MISSLSGHLAGYFPTSPHVTGVIWQLENILNSGAAGIWNETDKLTDRQIPNKNMNIC